MRPDNYTVCHLEGEITTVRKESETEMSKRLISIPRKLDNDLKVIVAYQYRGSMSEMVRECVRLYIDEFKKAHPDVVFGSRS